MRLIVSRLFLSVSDFVRKDVSVFAIRLIASTIATLTVAALNIAAASAADADKGVQALLRGSVMPANLADSRVLGYERRSANPKPFSRKVYKPAKRKLKKPTRVKVVGLSGAIKNGPKRIKVPRPVAKAVAKPSSFTFRSATSPQKIKWLASNHCLPVRLLFTLEDIAVRYGRVTVNSTKRSHAHNRKVGGARHSYHLNCNAVDFRVHGNYRGALAFLRKQSRVGGIKHYGGGLFHIDTGPRRTW